MSVTTALRAIGAALLLGLLLAAVPAQAARHALVIGNRDYAVGALANPVNDAQSVAAELGAAGFAVTLVRNLRRERIASTVEDFARSVKPGDDVVVFYAGHGVQVRGTNYFPAVDAAIRVEGDVPLNSLSLNDLLERLDEARAGVRLLLIDACRDNPYAAGLSRGGNRGLARLQAAPAGTLIQFATRPGGVAADGDGRNGRYTGELLRHLRTPGVPVELLLKRVASAVRQASGGEQLPWTEGALDGDFYIVAPPPAAPAPPPAASADAVAVAGFGGDATLAASVSRTVLRNLERSAGFRSVAGVPEVIDERARPDLVAWRTRGVAWLVTGSVQAQPDGRLDLRYRLWRTADGQAPIGHSVVVLPEDLRLAAHRATDVIFEAITGRPGNFSRRVARVMPQGDKQALMITDADGANPLRALVSPRTIGLPVWSPRTTHLIYVSFESGPAAFFVQELATGKRQRVPDAAPLTAACADELAALERGPGGFADDWRDDSWFRNSRSGCLGALRAALGNP